MSDDIATSTSATPPAGTPDYRPEWVDTDGGFRGGGWDVLDEEDVVRFTRVKGLHVGRVFAVILILLSGVAIPTVVLLLDDDPAFLTPQKILAFVLFLVLGAFARAGAARITESIPAETLATWHRASASLRLVSPDRTIRADRIEHVELIWVTHQRHGGPNSPECHCVLLVKDSQGNLERLPLGFAAHNMEKAARRLAELADVPLVWAPDIRVPRPELN